MTRCNKTWTRTSRSAGHWFTTIALPAVLLTAGCSEIARTLDEIDAIQGRVRASLEQQVEDTAAEAAAAQTVLDEARSAYENAPGVRRFGRSQSEEDVEKDRLYDVWQEARSGSTEAAVLNRNAEQFLDAARTRHASQLRQLRTAYEDDTWDLINPDVSPRSIVLNTRREAERELSRLEAGCMSPVQAYSGLGSRLEPDCESGSEE